VPFMREQGFHLVAYFRFADTVVLQEGSPLMGGPFQSGVVARLNATPVALIHSGSVLSFRVTQDS
jgi:hypothetical protein